MIYNYLGSTTNNYHFDPLYDEEEKFRELYNNKSLKFQRILSLRYLYRMSKVLEFEHENNINEEFESYLDLENNYYLHGTFNTYSEEYLELFKRVGSVWELEPINFQINNRKYTGYICLHKRTNLENIYTITIKNNKYNFPIKNELGYIVCDIDLSKRDSIEYFIHQPFGLTKEDKESNIIASLQSMLLVIPQRESYLNTWQKY